MLEAGLDTAQVASHLGTSERSVRRLINRNQHTGSVKDRSCSGRTKITTHAEDQRMVTIALH